MNQNLFLCPKSVNPSQCNLHRISGTAPSNQIIWKISTCVLANGVLAYVHVLLGGIAGWDRSSYPANQVIDWLEIIEAWVLRRVSVSVQVGEDDRQDAPGVSPSLPRSTSGLVTPRAAPHPSEHSS